MSYSRPSWERRLHPSCINRCVPNNSSISSCYVDGREIKLYTSGPPMRYQGVGRGNGINTAYSARRYEDSRDNRIQIPHPPSRYGDGMDYNMQIPYPPMTYEDGMNYRMQIPHPPMTYEDGRDYRMQIPQPSMTYEDGMDYRMQIPQLPMTYEDYREDRIQSAHSSRRYEDSRENRIKNFNSSTRHEDGRENRAQTSHLSRRYKDYSALDNEIRIVLIGRTGSGKSATGNAILGFDKFRSYPSGSSLTKKCQKGETIYKRNSILVVDTPGMFDTNMTNKRVLQEVVKCIGMTAPGPHAFILVVSVGRFTEEEENTVKLFTEHFSIEILNYMIVLFTRRDELDKSGISIRNYIRQVPNSLKRILYHCGNRCIAFDNNANEDMNIAQVQELINLIKKTVRRNGRSFYSNAMYKAAEAKIKQWMDIERRQMLMKYEREKDEWANQVSKPLYKTIQRNEEQIKRLQKRQEILEDYQYDRDDTPPPQMTEQLPKPELWQLRSRVRTKIQKENKGILNSICGGFKKLFTSAAGAVAGATLGATVGGPIGGPVGAVVGGFVGLFKSLFD